jgi:3-isopropylmalate/(R)-2-methylmalate dehydratase small subunit
MNRGRAFIFGDNVDTDVLAPGMYMKHGIDVIARHCLEALDPQFAKTVSKGDMVVGGNGFGIGSSREQAAEALRHLGVSTIIAKSFGGIFYRNALNMGLYVLVCGQSEKIDNGHLLRTDPVTGRIFNETTGKTLTCDALPPFLLEMVDDGGLVPHLKKRFASRRTAN